MKRLLAIIKPSRLENVRLALIAPDIHGMTVSEIKGYGRQKGHSEIYRGAEYTISFVSKLKIEIAIEADRLTPVSQTIRDAANTSRIGDGKILFSTWKPSPAFAPENPMVQPFGG